MLLDNIHLLGELKNINEEFNVDINHIVIYQALQIILDMNFISQYLAKCRC